MVKIEKSKQIITPFGGINFVNWEIKNSKILVGHYRVYLCQNGVIFHKKTTCGKLFF